ncbi:MAG: Hsp20/alpha crystallin family protein [Anaerolineae bacterium]|nr:Hsp20/alpha crystallin family protein [Anaerolineae bacterium]
MYVTRWNPNRDVMSLRAAMDRLLEDSFVRPWSTEENGQRVANLPIDAYSTDNEIVVMAAVPGARPEDVEITVEGETLIIKGEIPETVENVNYLFAERFHGPFSRTLQLNVPVDVEHIEATFENGILTLVLPKAEEVRPKIIKVQAK